MPGKHLVLRADDVQPFQSPSDNQYLSQEILCSDNSGLYDGFLNRGTVRPRHTLAGGAHPDNDEIYYVESGHAWIDLGGDPTTGAGCEAFWLEPGMVVYIPANTYHSLRNESDHDLVILTIWPCEPTPGANGIKEARRAAWGTSFRVRSGLVLEKSEHGQYVSQPSTGWSPLARTRTFGAQS